MKGCPCCVGEKDQYRLGGKQLRYIDGDALGHYTFKAMTTWGTKDDFKHFLPRIYELLVHGSLGTDTFVALKKILYAGLEAWPAKEQQAVSDFMYAWWFDCWKEAFRHEGNYSAMEQLADEIETYYLSLYGMDLTSPLFGYFTDEVHKLLEIFLNRKEKGELSGEYAEKLENFFWRHRSLLETGADHYKAQQDEKMTAKLAAIMELYEFDEGFL